MWPALNRFVLTPTLTDPDAQRSDVLVRGPCAVMMRCAYSRGGWSQVTPTTWAWSCVQQLAGGGLQSCTWLDARLLTAASTWVLASGFPAQGTYTISSTVTRGTRTASASVTVTVQGDVSVTYSTVSGRRTWCLRVCSV